MRNLLITLKYNGKNYHGWQVQDNAITIQEKFQDAIEKVLKIREPIVGCSRTDSGVHANMYCCSLKTENPIPCEKFIVALNRVLPYDIAVIDCREVDMGFHARYHCKSKQYIYRIYNKQIKNPFEHGYSLHYKYDLDVDMLNRQAQDYIGKYDYCSFSGSKCTVENTVRNVKSASVERQGDFVVFTVEADGFLYNMVRIMVGTLLFIAQGRIEQGTIKDIIKSKDRSKAGKTAPACGLYLNKVNYGSEI